MLEAFIATRAESSEAALPEVAGEAGSENADEAPSDDVEDAEQTAKNEAEDEASTVIEPAAVPDSEPEPAPEPAVAATPEPAPTTTPTAKPEAPSEPAPTEKVSKPVSEPAQPRPPKREETQPPMDEYDQLAKAARGDAFIDGRPPVLNYEANMTKGREELSNGNYARARAYFDSALEVHPGSAEAMDALGDVATAVSDYASALRYYRVAAQRGEPEGYYKLGQTYERLGKSEEAVSAYYTYVKRHPQGRHAGEAKEAIRNLEPRAKLPPDPEPGSPPEPGQAPESSTP
jgi:outer membrane biosynthesis protein TonB